VLHDGGGSQAYGIDLRGGTMAAKARNPSYEDSRLYEMATLMAEDNDFAIFRAFSELNFLNILHLQHCLTASEKKLCEAFKQRVDVSEIIVEIRQLLKEYSEQPRYNLLYSALIDS
jgi:hypothetical protein